MGDSDGCHDGELVGNFDGELVGSSVDNPSFMVLNMDERKFSNAEPPFC